MSKNMKLKNHKIGKAKIIMISIFVYFCFFIGLIVIIKKILSFFSFATEPIKRRLEKELNFIMPKRKQKGYIKKSIDFEPELMYKIEELAEKSEREVNNQVKYMLKKYIEIAENK